MVDVENYVEKFVRAKFFKGNMKIGWILNLGGNVIYPKKVGSRKENA